MPKTLSGIGSTVDMLLTLWRLRHQQWSTAAQIAANNMDCVACAECQARMEQLAACIRELEEHYAVDVVHRN